MTPVPRETTAPPNSLIEKLVPGAYFHDAWALGQFLKAAGQTPGWVSA